MATVHVLVELLRGRDGLPGKDGVPWAQGPAGIKGPLVLRVEGLSTHGGERALVHKYRAPSYCTLVLLEGQSTTKQEVKLTTCACLRTQSTASPSHREMESKDMPMFMVQSIKLLYKVHMITMCLVLCAMCLLDQL